MKGVNQGDDDTCVVEGNDEGSFVEVKGTRCKGCTDNVTGDMNESSVAGRRGVVDLRAVAGIISGLTSIEMRIRKAKVEKMSMCLAVIYISERKGEL